MKRQSAAKSHAARPAASRKTRSCQIPRPGQKCPQCQTGKLDYDGALNLVCSQCGQLAFSGGFT